MLFSDDSDAEDPEPGATPASGRSQAPSHRSLQSASHCRRVLLPTLEGCQLSSSEGSSSSAQPRRGHRAAGTEEKRQQVTRRAPARRAKEERGLLRTIEEDKENKELDNSFELSQSCEEEEGAAGELWNKGLLGAFKCPKLSRHCCPQPWGPNGSVSPHRQHPAAPAQAGGCGWEARGAAAQGHRARPGGGEAGQREPPVPRCPHHCPAGCGR